LFYNDDETITYTADSAAATKNTYYKNMNGSYFVAAKSWYYENRMADLQLSYANVSKYQATKPAYSNKYHKQVAIVMDNFMKTKDLSYYYGTCGGYLRDTPHDPLCTPGPRTVPLGALDYDDLPAAGPSATAITEVRILSTLPTAWKSAAINFPTRPGGGGGGIGSFMYLIKGISFTSANGVFRSFPGMSLAKLGGTTYEPRAERSYIRAMSNPGLAVVSPPHVGPYSTVGVVTVSRTIGFQEKSTGARRATTPASSTDGTEEQNDITITGVLSVDISLRGLFDELMLPVAIGPDSNLECFKQTTSQQLSKPEEKTMCFLIDFNGNTIIHPLFYTFKDTDFAKAFFFGDQQPIMFQEMVNRGVMKEVLREKRIYGASHRQWEVDISALGSSNCPSNSAGESAGDMTVVKCSGYISDARLTGQFQIVAIPETNILFIRIARYVESVKVNYCGLLTETCPNVAAPSTTLLNAEVCRAGYGTQWVTEAMTEEAERNCRQPPEWQIDDWILTVARGADCPMEEMQLLVFTVALPGCFVILCVFLWVLYQMHCKTRSLSLRSACFQRMTHEEIQDVASGIYRTKDKEPKAELTRAELNQIDETPET